MRDNGLGDELGIDQSHVTWGEFAQTITAVAVLLSAAQSWRNGRTLKDVKHNTNSISQRNEAIAKELGIEEGLKQGRGESKT